MWASLTYANTYLLGKVGGESWDSLTDDQKERALLTAYRALDNDPMYSFPNDVSDKMRAAQTELAFFLSSNSDDSSQTMQMSGVSSFRIGNFSQSFKADSEVIGERQTYPQSVINLLSQYRANLKALHYVTRRETR